MTTNNEADLLRKILAAVAAGVADQKADLYRLLHEKQRMIESLKRENCELVTEIRGLRQTNQEVTEKIRHLLSRAYQA